MGDDFVGNLFVIGTLFFMIFWIIAPMVLMWKLIVWISRRSK